MTIETYKTGYIGDSPSITVLAGRKILCWLFAGIAILAPLPALSDSLMKPHRPTGTEAETIRDIAKYKFSLGRVLLPASDPDYLDVSRIYTVKVNLDDASEPEVALLINYMGGIGVAGLPLSIWKHRDGKWVQIAGQDMMDDTYFIVSPKR